MTVTLLHANKQVHRDISARVRLLFLSATGIFVSAHNSSFVLSQNNYAPRDDITTVLYLHVDAARVICSARWMAIAHCHMIERYRSNLRTVLDWACDDDMAYSRHMQLMLLTNSEDCSARAITFFVLR